MPALRNETIAIPSGLTDLLPQICAALAEGGAGDSALHIGDAIVRKDIDATSLLNVSLARNHEAVRTSALHMGFSPDLVWLVGELGSSPLADHLSSSIVHRPSSIVHRPSSIVDDRRSTIDDVWDRGYCPFCGSWPVFIESTGGTRTLRCSYCALGWSLQSQPVHLLRQLWRRLRRRGAGCRPAAAARRALREVQRLHESARCRGAGAIPAARHRRSGDDASGSRRHGSWLSPARAVRSRHDRTEKIHVLGGAERL